MTEQDDISTTVRQWTEVVRRARIGKSVKAVALMMASYADANGTRIFPGLAVLAVATEMNYNTVSSAVSKLQKCGLIERLKTSHQGRRHADEYRLVLAADVVDRVEILDPRAFKDAADVIRKRHRGVYKTNKYEAPKSTEDDDLRPTEKVAEPDAQPVDNPDLRPTGGVAGSHASEVSATRCVTAEPGPATRFEATCDPVGGPPPIHGPSHNYYQTNWLSSTVTQPVAEVAVDDSESNFSEHATANTSLPDRCEHGLKARLRADGKPSCALCRRNVPAHLQLVTPEEAA